MSQQDGVVHSAIVAGPIDLGRLYERVQASGIGAVSMFVGTVRDVNEGRSVTGMDYEAYESMAAAELRAVASEVCAQMPDLRVALEHRVGTLALGEASVVIAAAHPHRGPAIEGARQIIEALKHRVPIWKREHYVDGERAWVDPTLSRARASRPPAGDA